jgi:chromate reductase
MEKKRVGIIIGSARKDSWSRKIAEVVIRLFPRDFDVSFIKISDLQMYNQDFEDNVEIPKEWDRFRLETSPLDAILIVTPEYNRSIPPVLKNAIDIGSRPPGKGSLVGKFGAVISISPGNLGGFGANHAVRQALVFLNIHMLQQPEAYIGNVNTLFNNNSEIEPKTKEFLQNFVDAFVKLILN